MRRSSSLALVLLFAATLIGAAPVFAAGAPTPASCAGEALILPPVANASPATPATPAADAIADPFGARIDEAGCLCSGIMCSGQFCWCQCVGDGRCCASCCRS